MMRFHLDKDTGDLRSFGQSYPYKNKRFEERAEFFHSIYAGVRGKFPYIGYLRGFWSVLFYSSRCHLIIILVVVIDV